MNSWRDEAACLGTDPALFFPANVGIRGGQNRQRTQDAADQTKTAKELCRMCPVTSECLDYALRTNFPKTLDYGIWGGTTPRQRRHTHRRVA